MNTGKIRALSRGINKKQQGITLLEMVIVIGLLAVIAVGELDETRRKYQQMKTRQLAHELQTYNKGVKAHIAFYLPTMTNVFTPPQLTGNQLGVNWLKTAACGGTAPRDFVPCDFLTDTGGLTRFGDLTLETFFDSFWDGGQNRADVTAITIPSDYTTGPALPLQVNGQPAPALSGLAALIISGISEVTDVSTMIAINGESVYCVTTATRPICNDPVYAPNFAVGKITLSAANSATVEPWLRVDGGNDMLADISFDDTVAFDNREILNVSRILGNFAGGEGIEIGASGRNAAVPTANQVLIDADQIVFGNMTVQLGDLLVNDGLISAIAGARPNSGQMRAHSFLDNDDLTWLLDPNGSSRLLTVRSRHLAADAGQHLYIGTEGNLGGSGVAAGADTFIRSQSDIFMNAAATFELTTPRGRMRILSLGGDNTIQLDNTQDINLIGTKEVALNAPEIDLTATDLDINTEINNITVNVGGVPVALNEMLPNWLHKSTVYVTDGGVVAKPVCQVGWTPQIIAVPAHIDMESMTGTNVNVGGGGNLPSRGEMWIYATDGGGTWTVYLRTPYAGTSGTTGSALAQLYCYRALN